MKRITIVLCVFFTFTFVIAQEPVISYEFEGRIYDTIDEIDELLTTSSLYCTGRLTQEVLQRGYFDVGDTIVCYRTESDMNNLLAMNRSLEQSYNRTPAPGESSALAGQARCAYRPFGKPYGQHYYQGGYPAVCRGNGWHFVTFRNWNPPYRTVKSYLQNGNGCTELETQRPGHGSTMHHLCRSYRAGLYLRWTRWYSWQ